MTTERAKLLLRLDPAVHNALTRWALEELRSTTAQIEFLLRQALTRAERMPGDAGRIPRRGRPRKTGGAQAEHATHHAHTDTRTDTDTHTDNAGEGEPG